MLEFGQPLSDVGRVLARDLDNFDGIPHDAAVAGRAKNLGIRSVPAVVIDGQPADCCSGRGPDEATLKAAGLGQPAA